MITNKAQHTSDPSAACLFEEDVELVLAAYDENGDLEKYHFSFLPPWRLFDF